MTAERTAQGLVEAREAGLPKPPKIPAPQPEVEVRPLRPKPAAAAPAAKAPSKIDLIRAKARGEARSGRGRRAAPRPRRRPRAGCQAGQEGQAGGGPAQPGLAGRREAQGAGRAARCRARRGDRTIVQAGLLVAAGKLVDGRPLPPRQEPDPLRLPRQPSERPLRRLHRGQLPARQHEPAGQPDRAPGADRRGRGQGRSSLALPRLSRGRFPGARSLRHDGGAVHRPPRAEADPDVGRLRLLPAPQGLSRALLRGTRRRSFPAGSRRASASISGPRRSIPTAPI